MDRVRRDPASTGNWNLYIVPADGGPVKPLTSDAFNNVRPSWSLDGRWIYFGSDPGAGDWQIWKMPSAGGTPVQMTRGGGYEPIVSPDGRHVFYAKAPSAEGIWSSSCRGRPGSPDRQRGSKLNFDVAENGIFMMDTSAKPQATVEMFSFSSRTDRSGRAAAAGRAVDASLLPHRYARRALDALQPIRFVDERHRDAARVPLKTERNSFLTPGQLIRKAGPPPPERTSDSRPARRSLQVDFLHNIV